MLHNSLVRRLARPLNAQGSSSPSARVHSPHMDEDHAHTGLTSFALLRTPRRILYSRHEAMTRDAGRMQDAARRCATGGSPVYSSADSVWSSQRWRPVAAGIIPLCSRRGEWFVARFKSFGGGFTNRLSALMGWKTGMQPHPPPEVRWSTRKDDRRSLALPSCSPPIRFTSPLLEPKCIRLDDGPLALVRFARRGASAIGRRHPQRSSIAATVAAASPCSTTERAAAVAASRSASFRGWPASRSAMRTVTSRWANLMPSRANTLLRTVH